MAWFGAQAHCALPPPPFSSPSSPLLSPPRPPGLCLQKPGRAASCFCSLLFSLLLSLSCFPQGSNLSPLVFLLPCLPLALLSPHPSLFLAKKGKIPHGPGPWPPPCSYVLLPLDNRSGGLCGDPGAWGGSRASVPRVNLQHAHLDAHAFPRLLAPVGPSVPPSWMPFHGSRLQSPPDSGGLGPSGASSPCTSLPLQFGTNLNSPLCMTI